jgi:tetratricopeptide (TPR) repeat protein
LAALLTLLFTLTVVGQSAAQNPDYRRRVAAEHAHKARTLAARGDTALALAQYAEALRHDETYGPAWLGFGQLREALGDPQQAELAYSRAADFAESRSAALEARSALRSRSGRFDEALVDLQAATDLAPTPERLELLGQRYAERRAWAAALATWRRLLDLVQPDSDRAQRARVEIRALTILSAELDPVTGGAHERGWVRAALRRIALRRAGSHNPRKLAP